MGAYVLITHIGSALARRLFSVATSYGIGRKSMRGSLRWSYLGVARTYLEPTLVVLEPERSSS